MGDGRKAWAEEEEDLAYQRKVKRFKEKDIVEAMFDLEKVEHSVDRFLKTDPTLTRVQWDYINYIEKTIKALLK